MKLCLTIFLFSLVVQGCIAQAPMEFHYRALPSNRNVRQITTLAFDSDVDTVQSIFEHTAEFNLSGNVVHEYKFLRASGFFYSESHDNIFDPSGALIEKLSTEDGSGLRQPRTTRTLYHYHDNGALIKEELYRVPKYASDTSKKPDRTLAYHYLFDADIMHQQPSMAMATHEWPDQQDDFSVTYHYNDQGTLIKKTVGWGIPGNEHKVETTRYDSLGSVIEKQEKQRNGWDWNIINWVKYEYDLEGFKSKCRKYFPSEDAWRDQAMPCNDWPCRNAFDTFSLTKLNSGLISEEIWQNSETGRWIKFVSTYAYH
jgi:hypothetical protein